MVALPSISDITAVLPSTQDVLQQVALSAATGVVVAGIKNQAANGSLDPLGLFHQQAPAAPAVPAPVAPVAVAPTTIPHTKVAASVWATMSPSDKAMLTASGVEIVAG